MRKLLKSFKTEINPTTEQKVKISKTIGTCRYVYNFYLGHNKRLHDKGEKFLEETGVMERRSPGFGKTEELNAEDRGQTEANKPAEPAAAGLS